MKTPSEVIGEHKDLFGSKAEWFHTDDIIKWMEDYAKPFTELCKQQHEALLASPYSEQKRRSIDAFNKLFK